MIPRKQLMHSVLIGAVALVAGGARFSASHQRTGPVLAAAESVMTAPVLAAGSTSVATAVAAVSDPIGTVASHVNAAVDALGSLVRPLSNADALSDAFKAYFAFKTAHPDEVKKPYLYFVDYGLPSTTARGYVFDMSTLTIVEGPFTVAHGRSSSSSQYGVPTHFSNGFGSAATSLGLYVTDGLYPFHGRAGGQPYSSIGVRLTGESAGFNDNAFARGVVAHGAPYVTPTKAGRSEGCPAMEPSRAERLLPKLANGSVVFLFAPNATWLAGDPWIGGSVG